MNDCPNAGIRDRLPDLVHGGLDASTRAAVLAHVGECADCRSELELIRGIHEMLVAQAPRVDVTWVAAALPKPPQRRMVSVQRRTWSDWRIAATVTLLVAGGSSVAIYHRIGARPSSRVAIIDSSSPIQAPVMNAVQSAPVTSTIATSAHTAAETVALAQVTPEAADFSDPIDNLDDSQLDALVNDIDHLEAVPITEPDPVSIRIGGRSLQASELAPIDPVTPTGRRGGV